MQEVIFIYIVCLNVDCNITAIIDSVSAPFSSLLELDRGLGPVLASRAQPSPNPNIELSITTSKKQT